MKTALIFFTLILISACSSEPNIILGEQIENAFKACEQNNGLQAVSVTHQGLVTLCKNSSFLSQPKNEDSKVSFYPPSSITASELVSCQNLCSKNNKIKNMTVDYFCTGARSCHSKEVTVTCYCGNSITQVYNRKE